MFHVTILMQQQLLQNRVSPSTYTQTAAALHLNCVAWDVKPCSTNQPASLSVRAKRPPNSRRLITAPRDRFTRHLVTDHKTLSTTTTKASFLGGIAMAKSLSQRKRFHLFLQYVSVAWSVCLSHSYTLLKPFDRFR